MSKLYTRIEEYINSVTHGLGIIFGVVALTILLVFSIMKRDFRAILSFSIYGASIILMYSFSTLYHAVGNKKAKELLRLFDHSSIFIFIAGTYTPIALLTLEGTMKYFILIGIWAMALGGIAFKFLTYGSFDRYEYISLGFYIAMGWLAVIPIRSIIRATSINFFFWILAGGLLYTLGTIFYGSKRIPYNHAIWHVFVLAASLVHFLGIVLHLA